MNVELAGALVGALASVVTVWPPCARALGRLTLNARAERQFHQAELFRRAGVTDEAEEHVRRARRFLLRPVVMEERGIVGTLAKADVVAYGLLLVAGGIALTAELSLPAALVGFGLIFSAMTLLLLDGCAIERECRKRAEAYDDLRSPRSSSRLRPWVASSALLGVALLVFRR